MAEPYRGQDGTFVSLRRARREQGSGEIYQFTTRSTVMRGKLQPTFSEASKLQTGGRVGQLTARGKFAVKIFCANGFSIGSAHAQRYPQNCRDAFYRIADRYKRIFQWRYRVLYFQGQIVGTVRNSMKNLLLYS